MFKFIKKLKVAYKRHKAENDLFMNDFYFYREESNLYLYDRTAIQIFLNGKNIYSDSPRYILTKGSYYFSGYDYITISRLKLLIFLSLFDEKGHGIEFAINGDRWKVIKSRYLFRNLLKIG